ncbi:MAG TPA: protein phosphatase 2C domain-containing protein [Chthonomonadaceae bacterium]|nr:protein phosphatase 2C domain-containing protein [Chthonomonadaceae bacterium]
MHADGVFYMGKTHTVCQDYVLARGGERPRVLLADGCSSSPDTDIGARLLVRMAAQYDNTGEACLLDAVVAARIQAALLGLEDRALDATLLEIRVEGDRWEAGIHGDGVLAWADHNGVIHAFSLTYAAGYPNYPNYLADPARRAAFLLQVGNDRRCEEVMLLPDGEVRSRASFSAPACAPGFRKTGSLEDTRWVAILSDGIHSFVQTAVDAGGPTTAPVPWTTPLRELLAFKSLNGAFVQRRLQRFLRECEPRRWQHRDDLAVATLVTG